MKINSFCVENYRCFKNSSWIDVKDITVLIGKNESGKTALLKALHKLNPYRAEDYNMDREWPRGRRKERSGDKYAVAARFILSDAEKNDLVKIEPSVVGNEYIEIKKSYDGRMNINFYPEIPDDRFDFKLIVQKIKEKLGELPNSVSEMFEEAYASIITLLVKELIDNPTKQNAIEKLNELRAKVLNLIDTMGSKNMIDKEAALGLVENCDLLLEELKVNPGFVALEKKIRELMPIFVYMDDFKIFRGSAKLDEIFERKKNGELTYEDETIINILEMSGLTLEGEIEAAYKDDKEQRVLNMNDAGQTLTREIASRWSQKKYDVVFQADGYHFIVFIKDEASNALIPLEERSKGFQWFFSFDMTFMHETKGRFANAVILLDEPGLHLHPSAKNDLLKRIEAFSKNNQIIYTTHDPFMIDIDRTDNVYILEEKKDGAIAHNDWMNADKEALFAYKSALAISLYQSVFFSERVIFTPSFADFWILESLSEIFKEASLVGIDEGVTIIPLGGATNFAYIGYLLSSQPMKILMLTNEESDGRYSFSDFFHQWFINDSQIIRLEKIFENENIKYLEDLFDQNYFIGAANKAYKNELKRKRITIDEEDSRSAIVKAEESLKSKGIEKIDRNKIAKTIAADLASKRLGDLQPITLNNFRKLFTYINLQTIKWHK